MPKRKIDSVDDDVENKESASMDGDNIGPDRDNNSSLYHSKKRVINHFMDGINSK
jgi:hypothetical protein